MDRPPLPFEISSPHPHPGTLNPTLQHTWASIKHNGHKAKETCISLFSMSCDSVLGQRLASSVDLAVLDKGQPTPGGDAPQPSARRASQRQDLRGLFSKSSPRKASHIVRAAVTLSRANNTLGLGCVGGPSAKHIYCALVPFFFNANGNIRKRLEDSHRRLSCPTGITRKSPSSRSLLSLRRQVRRSSMARTAAAAAAARSRQDRRILLLARAIHWHSIPRSDSPRCSMK